eukprot:TRINITY_DN47536_c0_g1_i1.p1 TRINITY_DN47536_c0_g1~~TRINITY_DN47536_c0_g1_i1.p1  ORF type:complete len:240 (-),score=29.85 TRINITY_DN47536_c0_g1_i1:565-1284(-)
MSLFALLSLLQCLSFSGTDAARKGETLESPSTSNSGKVVTLANSCCCVPLTETPSSNCSGVLEDNFCCDFNEKCTGPGQVLVPAARCQKTLAIDQLDQAIVKELRYFYGALYGESEPPGEFLYQRLGIAHFKVSKPEVLDEAEPRWAVLSHGLGTSMRIYDGPGLQGLLQSGFHVLAYDFYGNHWSIARDACFKYDAEVFLEQVAGLLDFVIGNSPIELFVGHSTGGLVGSPGLKQTSA